MTVDLNCDMGEGFPTDIALLAHVTSANIACGLHAGDPHMMRRTIEAAAKAGVAVGAHPGFADREGFGRRGMDVSAEQAYDLMVYQIGALAAFAKIAGARLTHVKPHGALYNAAARDAPLADALARAVRDVDAELALYGLAGSELVRAARRAGLRGISECFADRNYNADGSLVSRGRPDAVLTDPVIVAERVVRMVREGRVRAVDGKEIEIVAETICIHGDGAHAVEFARSLRAALVLAGVSVAAPK